MFLTQRWVWCNILKYLLRIHCFCIKNISKNGRICQVGCQIIWKIFVEFSAFLLTHNSNELLRKHASSLFCCDTFTSSAVVGGNLASVQVSSNSSPQKRRSRVSAHLKKIGNQFHVNIHILSPEICNQCSRWNAEELQRKQRQQENSRLKWINKNTSWHKGKLENSCFHRSWRNYLEPITEQRKHNYEITATSNQSVTQTKRTVEAFTCNVVEAFTFVMLIWVVTKNACLYSLKKMIFIKRCSRFV